MNTVLVGQTFHKLHRLRNGSSYCLTHCIDSIHSWFEPPPCIISIGTHFKKKKKKKILINKFKKKIFRHDCWFKNLPKQKRHSVTQNLMAENGHLFKNCSWNVLKACRRLSNPSTFFMIFFFFFSNSQHDSGLACSIDRRCCIKRGNLVNLITDFILFIE